MPVSKKEEIISTQSKSQAEDYDFNRTDRDYDLRKHESRIWRSYPEVEEGLTISDLRLNKFEQESYKAFQEKIENIMIDLEQDNYSRGITPPSSRIASPDSYSSSYFSSSYDENVNNWGLSDDDLLFKMDDIENSDQERDENFNKFRL